MVVFGLEDGELGFCLLTAPWRSELCNEWRPVWWRRAEVCSLGDECGHRGTAAGSFPEMPFVLILGLYEGSCA